MTIQSQIYGSLLKFSAVFPAAAQEVQASWTGSPALIECGVITLVPFWFRFVVLWS